MKEDIKDPIDFVREIVRSAFWSVGYHELELPKARKKLAAAKEMIKRLGIDCDQVEESQETDDEGDPIETNVEQLACEYLEGAVNDVEHHELRLKWAHDTAAFATIMLTRGNYTEIDIAEVQKQADDQLKHK